MKKQLFLTIVSLAFIFNSFAQGPITGALHSCAWDTSGVLATMPGGVWSSSNTICATVGVTSPGSAYATVTAVWPGTSTITYTTGTGSVSAVYTVDPSPTAFAGFTTMCVGIWTIYTDGIPGGVWTSSDPGIAAIDSVTGHLTGVSAGPVDIWYTLPNGCAFGSSSLTITTSLSGPISGPASLCVGSTATYADAITSGTWASSNPSVATIDPVSGVATGMTAGTVNISYTNTGVCGAMTTVNTVTVLGGIATPSLSGPSSVGIGASITISASAGGGTWSSSDPSIATVSAAGVVYGVSAGSVAISYSLPGCTGTLVAATGVTVAAPEGISGHVLFSGSYTGPLRVWLISYNPTTYDLEAVDSATFSVTGSTSVYYQFNGLATDSFRVKASTSYDVSVPATGYIPTYYTMSFYWHDAAVIYHTSGTMDINKDITLLAGSTGAGTGFIGGSVLSGANRGTTDGSPVANLLVYAIDASSGAVAQQTYTNAGGNYAFTTLPYGSYLIHPELMNYSTIPYAGITLSSGNNHVSGANFIEHTLSHVISPANVGVKNVSAGAASVTVYPNPASDQLTLAWPGSTNEAGTVTITDVTGQTVYKTNLTIAAGGATTLHLPALASGTYMLSISSTNISCNQEIAIQH